MFIYTEAGRERSAFRSMTDGSAYDEQKKTKIELVLSAGGCYYAGIYRISPVQCDLSVVL